MATALEELKDTYIKELLDDYLLLAERINSIPDEIKSSLDALTKVIDSQPNKFDAKLMERLELIDKLHDQLKVITDQKAVDTIKAINTENLKNKEDFKVFLKDAFNSTVNDLKKMQTSSNNYLLTISASVSFFFIGAIVSFFIFNNF